MVTKGEGLLAAEGILDMVMAAMRRANAETEAAIQRLADARMCHDVAELRVQANRAHGGSLALLALAEQVHARLVRDMQVQAAALERDAAMASRGDMRNPSNHLIH